MEKDETAKVVENDAKSSPVAEPMKTSVEPKRSFALSLHGLVASRKAIVAMVSLLLASGAAWRHLATFQEAADFSKWVLGLWMGAQGIEDAAKHFNRKA